MGLLDVGKKTGQGAPRRSGLGGTGGLLLALAVVLLLIVMLARLA